MDGKGFINFETVAKLTGQVGSCRFIESLVRKKYFLTNEQSECFASLSTKGAKYVDLNTLTAINSKSDKKMLPEISIARLYFMIMEKIGFNTHEQMCVQFGSSTSAQTPNFRTRD
jgi:hypothetical protein